MNSATLMPGFADPVADAQRVFRAAMNALARPGTIQELDELPPAPAPFNAVACALVLALADHETSVWLDADLAQEGACAAHIRFHTGATITLDSGRATFAIVSDPDALSSLLQFAAGTLEYPDRSTTLILQVNRLAPTAGLTLSGPGIATRASLTASPLPPGFAAEMTANRRLFPRGVDILLASATALAGLPRTTIVE